MPALRRLRPFALAVAVSVAAGGCAGLSFTPGCGLAAADPMADGASRLSPGFQRHTAMAQQQAYQHKALTLGMQSSREIRRPGSVPMAQTVSPLCLR